MGFRIYDRKGANVLLLHQVCRLTNGCLRRNGTWPICHHLSNLRHHYPLRKMLLFAYRSGTASKQWSGALQKRRTSALFSFKSTCSSSNVQQVINHLTSI